MTYTATLWIYGALLIGSIFMMASWGVVAWNAVNAFPPRQWLREKFVVIALALHLHAVAATFLFGVVTLRLVGAPGYATSPSFLLLIPLIGWFVSKAALVWASSLEGNYRIWWLFMIVSVAWTGFVSWKIIGG